MTEPNRENIQKWVDALRSGEYEQGKGNLKTADGKFCCLGVACEISELGEWNGRYYLDASNFLPPEVQGWLGLSSSPQIVGVADGSAWYLNDHRGWSFDQIADAIERTYLS